MGMAFRLASHAPGKRCPAPEQSATPDRTIPYRAPVFPPATVPMLGVRRPRLRLPL